MYSLLNLVLWYKHRGERPRAKRRKVIPNWRPVLEELENRYVPAVGTSTVLSSSVNPSFVGQPVAISATVVPEIQGTGIPTEVVSFYDGDSPPGSASNATTIGTATLDDSGTATFNTSSLSLGAHTIWAVYSGDANFYGSTSDGFTQTVNAPSLTLAPVAYGNGRTVTLSGQVNDFNPQNDSVQFSGVVNDSASVNPDGTFTLTTQASGLGAVNAAAVNSSNDIFDAANVDITDAAMAINLSVAQAWGHAVYLSGSIVDADPTDLSIAFGGVVNDTIAVNSDGTFSSMEEASDLGTITAATVDPNNLVNLNTSVDLVNSAPSITLTVTYGTGRLVTLSGQVTDELPQDDIVTLTGVVNDSIAVNSDGTFSCTDTATGLGTITATTVDDWGANSNAASVELTSDAAALQLSAAQVPAPNTIVLSGAIIDADPTNLTVQFSGAFEGSAAINPDGTFSLTTQDATPGTINATVVDVNDQITVSSSVDFTNDAPQISYQVSYLGNQVITLSGQVADECPGGLTVSFTGVVQDSVTVNQDGTFSLTEQASGLGTIEASTTDWWGVAADPVDVGLAPNAPYVTLNVDHVSGDLVTVSGQVTADFAQDLPVSLSGIVEANVYTDSNGCFSLTTQVATLGSISAATQDDWGQTSNMAVTQFQVDAPLINFSISYGSGTTVTLSGNVDAQDPGNLLITFTGVVNDQVQTDANGNFTLTTDASALGTIQATTVDIWGQTSPTATLDMYIAPPVVQMQYAVITAGHTAVISGQVSCSSPADTTLVIQDTYGTVVGPVQPDANGNFTVSTQDLWLGAFNAVAADQWGQQSNPAAFTLSTDGPQISLGVSYGNQKWVTLAGIVTDVDVGQLSVQFQGGVTGQVSTNPDGTFSLTTEASHLGQVVASTVDLWGLAGSNGSVYLVNQAPTISQFTAVNNGNRQWVFSGHVNDESAQGLTVRFGGLASLANKTAVVDTNGMFSICVQLGVGESGTVTARTSDWWSLQSNVAMVDA